MRCQQWIAELGWELGLCSWLGGGGGGSCHPAGVQAGKGLQG